MSKIKLKLYCESVLYTFGSSMLGIIVYWVAFQGFFIHSSHSSHVYLSHVYLHQHFLFVTDVCRTFKNQLTVPGFPLCSSSFVLPFVLFQSIRILINKTKISISFCMILFSIFEWKVCFSLRSRTVLKIKAIITLSISNATKVHSL